IDRRAGFAAPLSRNLKPTTPTLIAAMNSDADRIIGVYHRTARAWALDRVNRLSEGACLDRFRGLLPAGASVLDIGCGSGEPIARYLVAQGCNVTGVDSSPELIALCNASFPDLSWHVAD